MGIEMVLPWFCQTKPMLKYEYNYYLNMVFVRQNQGRTISIPILDAQSKDGFSTQSQDGFYAICSIPGWVFVKNQPKNPGWTLITFPCAGEQVNQQLLYRESDSWYVGLVVQKARKQGTIC